MTRYDEIPYPGGVHGQTHPGNLAAIATVLGMTPRRQEFRVLELGCGNGENLIPMAYTLPGCAFVGIDLAGTAIARGKAFLDRAGIANVHLEAMDILEFPASMGEFDYIIAHGVYSWVPAAVRERVLAICRGHLAPQGVAFISFNAYPGGHIRVMFRDQLRRLLSRVEAPSDRVAGAHRLLEAMRDHAADVGSVDVVQQMVKAEAERLLKTPTAVLLHDDLSEINQFFYFDEFAADAARHGLQFLNEAEFHQSTEDYFKDAPATLLEACGDDLIAREQMRDMLKCRRFRQPLLVRAEASVRRPASIERMLDLHAVARVSPTSPKLNLAPGVEVEFRKAGGAKFATNHTLSKALFSTLASTWPQSIPVARLMDGAVAHLRSIGAGAHADAEQCRTALDFLFDTYRAGFLELSGTPASAGRKPGERPRASLVSRLRIVDGDSTITLTHENIHFETRLPRDVVQLLDGSRDRAALLEALAGDHPDLQLPELEKLLAELGRMGFLHAD